MKVIFLDFDGVLNSVAYHTRRHQNGLDMHEGARPCLDPVAVAVLNKVVEATGALIVVTSTWRLGASRARVAGWLSNAGCCGVVLGLTGQTNKERGHDIQEWLDAAAVFPNRRFGPVTHFVILDDDTDMAHLYDHLVKIDDQDGLTEAYLPAILKHLEG